jgi:glycerol 2-dehydrogenase (NADP+)
MIYRACPQQDVVDYCTSKGIVLTSYSSLGSEKSPLLENEVVQELAKKHNVTPANILISLQANRPNVTGEDHFGFLEVLEAEFGAVLAKSVTNERILCKILSKISFQQSI